MGNDMSRAIKFYERLTGWLKRVEDAGGKILVPKTPTGDKGVFAYFEDSEGNRVGLHAAK